VVAARVARVDRRRVGGDRRGQLSSPAEDGERTGVEWVAAGHQEVDDVRRRAHLAHPDALRRQVQGRASAPVHRPDVGPMVQEDLHDTRVPALGGVV